MVGAGDVLLIAGATARLTRAITTDTLGDRYVREPAERWALSGPDGPVQDRRAFLTDGLGCPYCVGFWVGVAVAATHTAARTAGPRALAVWRFGAGVLTLNYAVAHLSAQID